MKVEQTLINIILGQLFENILENRPTLAKKNVTFNFRLDNAFAPNVGIMRELKSLEP